MSSVDEKFRDADVDRLLRRLKIVGESNFSGVCKHLQGRPAEYVRSLVESLVETGKVATRDKPLGEPGRPCSLYRVVE